MGTIAIYCFTAAQLRKASAAWQDGGGATTVSNSWTTDGTFVPISDTYQFGAGSEPRGTQVLVRFDTALVSELPTSVRLRLADDNLNGAGGVAYALGGFTPASFPTTAADYQSRTALNALTSYGSRTIGAGSGETNNYIDLNATGRQAVADNDTLWITLATQNMLDGVATADTVAVDVPTTRRAYEGTNDCHLLVTSDLEDWVEVATTGAGSWSVPTGTTSALVWAWGAGGGGGNGTSQEPGGGGGAFSAYTFTGLTGGSSIVYYSVGAGGAPAATGGDTWANTTNTPTGAPLIAKGGTGGLNATAGVGGSAAAGAGTVKHSGGNGAAQQGGGGSRAGSGGGSSATPQGGGQAGIVGAGSAGGENIHSHGWGGTGASYTDNGSRPGGGGGGRASFDATAGSGGRGHLIIAFPVASTTANLTATGVAAGTPSVGAPAVAQIIDVGGGQTEELTDPVETVVTFNLTGKKTQPSANDVVFALVSEISTSDVSFSAISGYTKAAELYANDDYDTNMALYYKVMTATPDTTITVPGSVNKRALSLLVFENVDPTSPLDVAVVSVTAINNGQPNPEPITPVNEGSKVLVCGGSGAATADAAVFTSGELASFVTRKIDSGGGASHVIGMGTLSWGGSGEVNPTTFGGNTAATTASWGAFTVALRSRTSLTVSNLTATGVAAGASTVGAPTLTQAHVLTATGVDAAAPTVDAPTLMQTHALTATGVDAATPTVGTPVLTQAHTLTTTGVDAAAPTVGTPVLTQAHTLTATGVDAGTPTVGSPSASGGVDLEATPVGAGAPTVDSPALTQVHDLTATGVGAGAPTVDSPALTQVHDLTATGVDAAAPTVDAPTLMQVHDLTATGVAATPTVDAPTLMQVHDLTATGVAATPTVDAPTLMQVHDLTAVSADAAPPAVDAPTLTQIHALTAAEVDAGVPEVGTPSLTGEVDLTATGVDATTPTVDAPTLMQIHVLTAAGVDAGAPTVGTPVLIGVVTLTTTGIAAGTPTVDAPTLTQIHILTSTGAAAAAPSAGSPALTQAHGLTAVGVDAGLPTVGAPSMTGEVALTATGVDAGTPAVGAPAMVSIVGLLAVEVVTGVPVVGTPTFVQVHALTAVGITSGVPVVGVPSTLPYSARRVATDDSANVLELGAGQDVVVIDSPNRAIVQDGLPTYTEISSPNRAE